MIAYSEGTAGGTSRYFWSVPSLDDLRLSAHALAGPHFACLLACDARAWNDEVILAAANHLLDRGLVYFCAWGPDCERVHDLVDSAIVLRDNSEYPIITTWHRDETLADALWFFLNAAYPDESFEATFKSRLAISVGNHEWAREIQTQLGSPIDSHNRSLGTTELVPAQGSKMAKVEQSRCQKYSASILRYG